jgi:hypothetical protein
LDKSGTILTKRAQHAKIMPYSVICPSQEHVFFLRQATFSACRVIISNTVHDATLLPLPENLQWIGRHAWLRQIKAKPKLNAS